MAGYIKLHRGWRDTDGLLPSAKFSDFEAWLWLLENCAWKPIARWNAKGEEIRLEPGQIHVSIRSLTTAWGWSRKAVTTFLARLERVQKVRLQRGQSGTVLTVCNWSKYQANGDSQGDSREASPGTVGGQSGDTQEEGKEGKEKKKDTRTSALSCPDGVSAEVWADFLTLRKAKRAPLTKTALSAIMREADKAGLSLEAALEFTVVKGWQAFNAQYYYKATETDAARGRGREVAGGWMDKDGDILPYA